LKPETSLGVAGSRPRSGRSGNWGGRRCLDGATLASGFGLLCFAATLFFVGLDLRFDAFLSFGVGNLLLTFLLGFLELLLTAEFFLQFCGFAG
jgi:hypothetical protein